MDRRTFVAASTALLSSTLAGCSSDAGTDDDGDGGGGETQIELSDVEHKTQSDVLHYLVGKAENVSDEDLEFQVRIDWFDEDDTLLGESFTQVNAEIAAGQTRAWDSTYFDAREHGSPDHYETEVHIY